VPTPQPASAAQVNPQSTRAHGCHFMTATLSPWRLTTGGRFVKTR